MALEVSFGGIVLGRLQAPRKGPRSTAPGAIVDGSDPHWDPRGMERARRGSFFPLKPVPSRRMGSGSGRFDRFPSTDPSGTEPHETRRRHRDRIHTGDASPNDPKLFPTQGTLGHTSVPTHRHPTPSRRIRDDAQKETAKRRTATDRGTKAQNEGRCGDGFPSHA
eukprot:scaffold1619_cov292-Pavlova_lutheri.AAC.11